MGTQIHHERRGRLRLHVGHLIGGALGGLGRCVDLRRAARTQALGREALADERFRSAGNHLSMAAVYYHFAKFVFVDYPEVMKRAHAMAVACLDERERLISTLRASASPCRSVVSTCRESAQARGDRAAARGHHGQRPDSAKEELRSTEQLFLDLVAWPRWPSMGRDRESPSTHCRSSPAWKEVGAAIGQAARSCSATTSTAIGSGVWARPWAATTRGGWPAVSTASRRALLLQALDHERSGMTCPS